MSYHQWCFSQNDISRKMRNTKRQLNEMDSDEVNLILAAIFYTNGSKALLTRLYINKVFRTEPFYLCNLRAKKTFWLFGWHFLPHLITLNLLYRKIDTP